MSKKKALALARRMADGGDISSPNYIQAIQDLKLTPQERALYQRHLTNLNGSGGVDNPDGSRSTLFQTTMENNGKIYNVPTVWNGKIEANFDPSGKFQGLSDQGVANIKAAGIENFPSYGSEDEAEARYQQMHGYMDKDTAQYFQNKAANMPVGDEYQPMNRGGSAGGNGSSGPVFEGYIHGATGGRTDNKDISVKSGAYVIPADILSGLGEGNSHAGWAAIAREYGLDKPHKADGGGVVPIVAASGEGVLPPEAIIAKHGDLDTGHQILDAMVKHVRAKTIKHLKRLPGPKKN